VEMMRKGLSVATPSGLVEPSPTCVTIPADEWGSKARKISPPKSAAAAYSPSSTGFTRYGGGVFATMRGSHNTYQTTVSLLHQPRELSPMHAHHPLPRFTACHVEVAPPAGTLACRA
jgi:hypothetical protein